MLEALLDNLSLLLIVAGVILVAVITVLIAPKKSKNKRKHEKSKNTELAFEEELITLYQNRDYKVERTPKYDFGADLLMTTPDGITVAIRAKKQSKLVGLTAVQEVYAAQAYYKTQEAWVITTSAFTDSAKKLSRVCDVRLINGEQLATGLFR